MVDLDKLRERLNSDGVIIVTKDELLAAADELALARQVVEAGEKLPLALTTPDHELTGRELLFVDALAAYRAKVGGQSG